MSMSIEDASQARQPRPVPSTPDNVLEQFKMTGKTVIVTGASDGIGYAVVESMVEAGGNVALWYNSNDRAVSKAEELSKKYGIKAKAYQVQISDHEQVQQTIQEVVKDFGKLDVFVANAGMGTDKGILDQSIEEYKKLFSVNGMLTLASVIGIATK